MIRNATFKYAVFGLFSAALVSVACSDDDDAIFDGGAGSAGKSGGVANGGKNTTAGSSSAGTSNGGANGGTSAGSGTAGKANNAGTGGSSAGMSNVGGAGAGAGGEGGAPDVTTMGGEGGVMSGGGAGGAGGEGGTPFVADVLDNPGFEANEGATITGWTNEGTTGAAYVQWKEEEAHGGHNKLTHWTMWTEGGANPDFTVSTFQTVAPIANGTYSFSVWVDRNWEKTQYLFARGFNVADAAEEKTQPTQGNTDPVGYEKITLSGIQVTSGSCTVGIYTSTAAGTYANFDDAEFVRE